MKSCVFFGHRTVDSRIRSDIYAAIEDLIVKEDVFRFYVGHQGAFDAIVLSVLRELKKKHPQIDYAVVFAYLPKKDTLVTVEESLFPEEVARAIPRFAIDARNRFLIKNCDCAIVYVEVSYGGAFKFASLAKSKGKRVINLARNDLL